MIFSEPLSPPPQQKITHTSASDSAVAFLGMITIEGTTLHSCRILQDDLLIQVGVLNEPNWLSEYDYIQKIHSNFV